MLAALNLRPGHPAGVVAMGLWLTGLTITVEAFSPGIMTWDSVRQYDQALSGRFDDWHPPAMEALWRVLVPLHQGPVLMFVLQIALYWAGAAMLAIWAWRARRPWLAAALVAAASMPAALAIMGAVVKDCLMAGGLLAATGIAALVEDRRAASWRAMGLALLIGASTLRFNAFLATAPIGYALLPPAWHATWLRRLAVTAALTLTMVAALPVANRLLEAERSGVELSLVIFDLGGITEHAGADAFPPIEGVRRPVAANHRCYTPVKWDSYSWWVDPLCPLEFYDIQDWFAEHRVNPELFWARAIMSHPVAYAAHRLAHFNSLTRFLVHRESEVAGQIEDAPNRWHYRVSDNAARRTINGYAALFSGTPVEWPIVWIALALGTLTIAPHLPGARTSVPVATSSALYGIGYSVVSVASELRYHLWTMIAAAIAGAIVTADLAGGAVVARWRLVVGYAPPLVVTALAIAWRLLPA